MFLLCWCFLLWFLLSPVCSLFLTLCFLHLANWTFAFPVQKTYTIQTMTGKETTVFLSSWFAPTGCLASSSACGNPFSLSQSPPVWKDMLNVATHTDTSHLPWESSNHHFNHLRVSSDDFHGGENGFPRGESFPSWSQEQRLLSVGPEHNPAPHC